MEYQELEAQSKKLQREYADISRKCASVEACQVKIVLLCSEIERREKKEKELRFQLNSWKIKAFNVEKLQERNKVLQGELSGYMNESIVTANKLSVIKTEKERTE